MTLAPLPEEPSPSDALTKTVIYQWNGQDIRTLPRKKLLQIIGELGSEVRQLRETNTALQRVKFYRR